MATAKQGRTSVKSGQAKPGQAKAAQAKSAQAKSAQGRPAQARSAQSRPGQSKADQTRRARDRARARELAEQRAAAEPAEVGGPPPWLRYTSLLLSLAGLGVSIYMTIEHFTGNRTLACSANSIVNCAAVTTSPESMVFGVIPVAVLGLAFFVFMVAATTPWAWRSQRREIALARLGSVVVGVGFIIYLIYVELFQVGFICLECTSVHVITFALFVLVALSSALYGLVPEAEPAAS